MSAGDRIADIEQAIATVEKSRQTHVMWRDYWLSLLPHQPEDCDECAPMVKNAGGLEHQERCIEGYDHVLTVLRAHLTESRESGDTPMSTTEDTPHEHGTETLAEVAAATQEKYRLTEGCTIPYTHGAHTVDNGRLQVECAGSPESRESGDTPDTTTEGHTHTRDDPCTVACPWYSFW